MATSVRWKILIILALASFISYVLRTNLSFAAPEMMTDLGLSEIHAIGPDQYIVVERDKGIGIGSKLKKIYAFSLRGLTPDADGRPDATDTVRKVQALDIVDEFFPYEKVEGLAITRNGNLWIGLDNDGGEVESRLINTGRFRNPLNR